MELHNLALPLALLVLGCNGSGGSTDPQAAPQTTIRIGASEIQSYSPALVHAMFPQVGEASAEISLAEEGALSVVVRTAVAEVQNVVATVVTRPIRDGESAANVLVGAEPANSGTVNLRIKDGRVSGYIDELSVRFDGNIVLTCLVPVGSLAASPGGGTVVATPEGEEAQLPALVIDSSYSSVECRRLAEKLL